MSDTLSLVLQALQFAARKHRHQRRKDVDQTPYINHPIALTVLLRQVADVHDPIVLMAALLHDTVEDTDTTLPELETTFGAEVAAVVAQLTDDKSLPRAMRKQQQIDHAPQLCDRARLVKLADKIDNLRDMATAPPAGWSMARRQAYCEWARRVVNQIRGSNRQLEAYFDKVYAHAIATCQTEQTPR